MPSLTGLPALDTAIGLVLLFFLLSTVCSSLNEALANILGWRAKTLEDGIRNLLGDKDIQRGWREWIGRLHKRVPDDASDTRPIQRGGVDAADGAAVTVPVDLTSALFDHPRLGALVRNASSKVRRRARPSYLPPRTFSLALAEQLAAGAPADDGGPSLWELGDRELFDRVQTVLANLPEGQGRELLQRAAANADGTLEGFRRHVERAFDDVMERASGWYKRKVQVVLALLAVVIAVGLNVDTAHVAARLWSDAPLRTAVANAAGRAGNAQGAAKATEQIQQLELPIGWGAGNTPKGVGGVVRSLPGWLLTIAALSLGAPFWFDLLSRLARLRGSGIPEKPRSLSDTAGTAGPRD